MITITPQDIERAEAEIRHKATKIAYETSEQINDKDLQTIMFNIIMDYIIIGARMMEEELQNKKDK